MTLEELQKWVKSKEDFKAELKRSMEEHPETVCACGCSSFYHSDDRGDSLEVLLSIPWYGGRTFVLTPDETGEHAIYLEWRRCFGCGKCDGFWRES